MFSRYANIVISRHQWSLATLAVMKKKKINS